MTVPKLARYRMKDLCELTGLSRQTIHFYIQQGLLPEGAKTGKNMAWYGDEHLERLALIKRLQDERFLPLKAIRALLVGETAHLEPAKRAHLAEVASRFDATPAAPPTMIDAAEVAAQHGIELAEIERMAELGVVVSRRDDDGRLQIPADAAWLADVWSQFRAVGFTAARGFTVDDLQVFENVVARLIDQETRMIADRLSSVPPEEVAQMIERALPLIHAVLIHLHTTAVRHTFTALRR